jgi:hypothetical protein
LTQKDDDKAFQIEAELSWGSLEGVPTIYANQLYIGFTRTEFYLVFGDLVLPLILNPSQENLPKELAVTPSVRLVVSHAAMVEFAKAINQNLGKYLEMQDRQSDEEQDS